MATEGQVGQAFKFPKATSLNDPAQNNQVPTQKSFRERLKDLKEEAFDFKELEVLTGGGGSPKEAGFQVKGGIDLGHYDVQAEQERARLAMEKVQAEKQQQLEQMSQALEESRENTRQLQMTAAVKEIGDKFASAITSMDRKIEEYRQGGGGPNAFERMTSEWDALTKLAERFASVGRPQGTPSTGDPLIGLQLEKLRMEEARAEREFKVRFEQMQHENRMALMKFDDERKFKLEELNIKRDQFGMLSKAPEVLGSAIASGLAAAANGHQEPEAPVERREATVSQRPAAAPASAPRAFAITAGVGEHGEAECPECNTKMAVGPDSTEAICSECSNHYPVKRVAANVS